MDFKQIEAFITVAKLKSFSKAANTIYLSQPTISSHILSLEKELKVQLFDRNSKEVNLTPAGKCFFDYAVDIINTRNTAISNLSDFNNNIRGCLNISASTTPCNTVVPVLVSNFSKLYPDITFNILAQSSGKIIDDIINLNCEIGIVDNIIDNDKIKSYCIMDDSLVLISNPSMNIPDKISLDMLKSYKFIMREKNSATRKTFETELSNIGYQISSLDICCEANTLDILIQFVKAGLGVSVVSKQAVNDYVGCGKLKSSTVDGLSLRRNIYLVVNSKRTLTPIARAFLIMCKEYFNLP